MRFPNIPGYKQSAEEPAVYTGKNQFRNGEAQGIGYKVLLYLRSTLLHVGLERYSWNARDVHQVIESNHP